MKIILNAEWILLGSAEYLRASGSVYNTSKLDPIYSVVGEALEDAYQVMETIADPYISKIYCGLYARILFAIQADDGWISQMLLPWSGRHTRLFEIALPFSSKPDWSVFKTLPSPSTDLDGGHDLRDAFLASLSMLRDMVDGGTILGFWPIKGTLIALLRYGQIWSYVDDTHMDCVDWDIDWIVEVESLEKFYAFAESASQFLSSLPDWERARCIVEIGSKHLKRGEHPEALGCDLFRQNKQTFTNVGFMFLERGPVFLKHYTSTDEFGLFRAWDGMLPVNLVYPYSSCYGYGRAVPCPASPFALLHGIQGSIYIESCIALPDPTSGPRIYLADCTRWMEGGLSQEQIASIRGGWRVLESGGYLSMASAFETSASCAHARLGLRNGDLFGGGSIGSALVVRNPFERSNRAMDEKVALKFRRYRDWIDGLSTALDGRTLFPWLFAVTVDGIARSTWYNALEAAHDSALKLLRVGKGSVPEELLLCFYVFAHAYGAREELKLPEAVWFLAELLFVRLLYIARALQWSFVMSLPVVDELIDVSFARLLKASTSIPLTFANRQVVEMTALTQRTIDVVNSLLNNDENFRHATLHPNVQCADPDGFEVDLYECKDILAYLHFRMLNIHLGDSTTKLVSLRCLELLFCVSNDVKL
eukprot:TRINITY_DN73027_c0_g1_i1.p1 TRINITY_DN73027_c0_g1~~TRINITY_DN73027_c0_g1_i1.p1  ORF type:complete len:689 (-),score=33.24 TRINITY_DN73027_c0_g1_i1:443-2389(-)